MNLAEFEAFLNEDEDSRPFLGRDRRAEIETELDCGPPRRARYVLVQKPGVEEAELMCRLCGGRGPTCRPGEVQKVKHEPHCRVREDG